MPDQPEAEQTVLDIDRNARGIIGSGLLEGLTLEEALDRLTPIELNAARTANVFSQKTRLSRSEVAFTLDGYVNPRYREWRKAQRAARIARAILIDSFIAVMTTGVYIAFGRPNDITAEPVEIAPDQWPYLRHFRNKSSELAQSQKSGTSFFAVRIFSALALPDAASRLAGLTIKDAFQRYVLEDPEVIALRLAADTDPTASKLLPNPDTGCFNLASRYWPVDGASHLRAKASGRTPVGLLGPRPTEANALYLMAIADRFGALMELLSSGVVVAKGHRGDGALETINRGIWIRPATRYDAQSGDVGICRVIENGEISMSFEPIWIAVELVLPAANPCRSERSMSADAGCRGKLFELVYEAVGELSDPEKHFAKHGSRAEFARRLKVQLGFNGADYRESAIVRTLSEVLKLPGVGYTGN